MYLVRCTQDFLGTASAKQAFTAYRNWIGLAHDFRYKDLDILGLVEDL